MDLKTMRAEVVPCESLTSLDKAENDKKTGVASEQTAPPGPITPNCNKESGKLISGLSSPLTSGSSPSKEFLVDSYKGDASFSHAINNSPRTPEVDVFDPFAPGPDKLALAPFCKKYSAEARHNAARKLDFDAPIPFSCSDITCGSGDMHLEHGNLISDLNTSVSCSNEELLVDSSKDDASFADANNSPRTPQEDVCDPFAPGPDKCGFAPRRKKYLAEERDDTARKLYLGPPVPFCLDVACGSGTEALSDEENIFRTVYGTLLEAIVLQQNEAVLAEVSHESNCKLLRTPTSAPLLNGIAETCPGAPMKPAGKPRNIDLSLCKKLEF